MKKSLIILILNLLIASAVAFGQSETEPVQLRNKYGDSEEFNVLKSDKSLRQGSYIKYTIVPGPRNVIAVLETGNYEKGQKEGEWRTYFLSPRNKLASQGSYHAGLPEGQWFYYYQPEINESGKTLFTGKNPKENLTFDLNDSTAVVHYKGLCHKGAKVGLWKYYDEKGTVEQVINESTNQLMYWRHDVNQPMSSEEAARNHPLLYIGGETQFFREVKKILNPKIFSKSEKTVLKKGQTNTAEFVVIVDSTGHQSAIILAPKTVPSKYEQFVLTELNPLTTHWLPQVVNGKAIPSEYHFLVIADEPEENTFRVIIRPVSK